ncbi:hypothetical protein L218DRAFT_997727 [Marasmius fiardii PR-910]|nr:hypothetical protein L218DRAFT_997727 [Marasmius fiardii PR-910]
MAALVLGCLPFDNIGVPVLANDDDTGSLFSNIIKYRLLDGVLDLEPFNWSELILGQVSGATTPDPRPKNATAPTVPGGFASLEGTYNDSGYGNWLFCLFAPSHQSSDACKGLVANASTVLPGTIDPTVPTLLAPSSSIWLSYLKLEHFDGNMFNVTGLLSYPTLNDTKQPFWTRVLNAPGYQAEFLFSNGKIGVGFSGGFWGAGPGVPDPHGGSGLGNLAQLKAFGTSGRDGTTIGYVSKMQGAGLETRGHGILTGVAGGMKGVRAARTTGLGAESLDAARLSVLSDTLRDRYEVWIDKIA